MWSWDFEHSLKMKWCNSLSKTVSSSRISLFIISWLGLVGQIQKMDAVVVVTEALDIGDEEEKGDAHRRPSIDSLEVMYAEFNCDRTQSMRLCVIAGKACQASAHPKRNKRSRRGW
jgi:hypothetical protein